jgi:hypothetical protein
MNPFALVVLLFLLVLYVLRELRGFRALKEFGGPVTASFSRLWLFRATTSGKMNVYFGQVNDEHGE